LVALDEWMREPDCAENFSLADITDWINRRPTETVARLIAAPVEQEPQPAPGWDEAIETCINTVASVMRMEPSTAEGPLFDALKSLRTTPAATKSADAGGWNEAIPDGWKLVPIKPSALNLEIAKNKFIASTYVLEQVWKWMLDRAPEPPALRQSAPPDTGARKSAWECMGRKQSLPDPGECNWPDCGCDPHATKVIENLVEQGWSAPDHGGADAGVRKALEALSFWCTSERLKLRDGRGGFDDMSDREIGILIVEAEIDKRSAALSHHPAPVAVVIDDPSADERWQAGLDFGMMQLCAVMGVDPKDVTWDAATETVDGDVRAVIWNILRAKMGEDWKPAPVDANASAELQNDLGEMLRALGMSDAAQPKSPHEVFQSAIAEMKRQLANASAEARLRDALKQARWQLDRIVGEYPVNHGSKFCLNVAKSGIREIDTALSAHPHASDCDKQGSDCGAKRCRELGCFGFCKSSDGTADVT
jgi:hypothetical protein